MAEETTRPSALPDFCSLDALFSIVVTGELLAFILVLRPGAGTVDVWNDLAMVSLFIQWVGLTGAGTLCVSRRWLSRLGPTWALFAAWALFVVIVAALSEVAFWLSASGWVALQYGAADTVSDTVFWLTQQPLVSLDLGAARHVDFLARTISIGAIVGAVALRNVNVQFQWKLNVEARARSRVAALQARIRPHFLFNSMNTIASFTRTKPDVAEQVVEDLSDLFRASLGKDDDRATLESELQLAAGYLRIEALRLGERLKVVWNVDGLPQNAQLPRLTLQPLVENAVYHGIEPLSSGGTIHVNGKLERGRVIITVTNPIPQQQTGREGSHMAQANVRERFQHQFANASNFDVSVDKGLYEVRLSMPYEGYVP